MTYSVLLRCINIVHYNMSTFVPYEHWNHNGQPVTCRLVVLSGLKKARSYSWPVTPALEWVFYKATFTKFSAGVQHLTIAACPCSKSYGDRLVGSKIFKFLCINDRY